MLISIFFSFRCSDENIFPKDFFELEEWLKKDNAFGLLKIPWEIRTLAQMNTTEWTIFRQ